MTPLDTICAPATPVGQGAISIIRISGPEAITAARRVLRPRSGKTLEEQQAGTIRLACAIGPDGSVLDEVMVSVFRAPHSYTGEDSVEISCHASAYIVSGLLDALCGAGCRMAGPGEFTQRAYLAGKMDLAQAEAVADLIAAGSRAAHDLALSQMRGTYSKGIRELRDKLLQLSALMELELDFSEEEVEFADRGQLRTLCTEARDRCASLADSFRTGNAIKNGIPVALVGDVNAGKSTLLNALVGDDRAIVSSVPGTTRDTVDETCVVGGVLLRFIDTAGIRESADEVERMGIERTFREIERAHVVVGVIDGALPSFEQREAAARIRSHVNDGQKLILVRNKSDIAVGLAGDGIGPDWLEISAFSNTGLDALRDAILAASDVYGIGQVKVGGDGFGAGEGLRAGDGHPGNCHTGDRDESGAGEVLRAGDGDGSASASYAVMVTSARHADALRHAALSLGEVCRGLDSSLPGDLLAEDLRAAISSLSDILGENITPDEVLGEVFGRFCIGK